MRRIINRKAYDTKTAKCIGCYDNGIKPTDFDYYECDLYRKSTGEFFLHHQGGVRMGPDNIEPISEIEAKKWVEEHDDVEYETIFGVEEHFIYLLTQ